MYLFLELSFIYTLSHMFNKLHNVAGIVVENLKWMYESAKQFEDNEAIFNGFLLLDEMGIQPDLQVIKKGES